MFRTPAPPPLPAGADRHPFPDVPVRGEPGARTFGRDINGYLTGDLPYQVHALLRGSHRHEHVVRGARTTFDEAGRP